MEYDPLATSTGLPDDYDATVVEARFFTDPKYNDGNTLLAQLLVESEDPEIGQQDLRYPFGPEWRTFDTGKTAEHPRDGKKLVSPNRNTAYGQLIFRAISDNESAMRARLAEVPAGPRAAEFWIGMTAHWNIEETSKTFNDRNTGQQVTRASRRWWPSQIGFSAVTVQKPTLTELNAGGIVLELPQTLAALVKSLAATKNHSDFIDAVLEQDGAIQYPNLIAALEKPEFYAGLTS